MPLIALQLAVHQASTLASPTKASQNNLAILRVDLRSARRACTWVRGKDLTFRNALSIDSIDKHPVGWGVHDDHPPEYTINYDADPDGRGLGAFANMDWEQAHLEWEKKQSQYDADKIRALEALGVLLRFVNFIDTSRGDSFSVEVAGEQKKPAFWCVSRRPTLGARDTLISLIIETMYN